MHKEAEVYGLSLMWGNILGCLTQAKISIIGLYNYNEVIPKS